MHIVRYEMQIQINMKNKVFFLPECFKKIYNQAKYFKNFSLQAVKSKRSTSSLLNQGQSLLFNLNTQKSVPTNLCLDPDKLTFQILLSVS